MNGKRPRRVRPVLVALSTFVALGLVSCAGDDDETAGPGTVDVVLADFTIELGTTSAPAGEVTFKVENKGPSLHEFVVFKTDLAPDALPTDESGDVAENEAFAPVDEIEDIEKGDSPELTVDLEAGKYVFICNVPAHYRQGMRAAFVVS